MYSCCMFGEEDYDVFEVSKEDVDVLKRSFWQCVSGEIVPATFRSNLGKTLYDNVVDFLKFATEGYPSKELQRSAKFISNFLQQVFLNVTYEGVNYNLSFEEIDNSWHAVLEKDGNKIFTFAFDNNEETWREKVESGKVTFPYFDNNKSSLPEHLRNDFLFDELCEDYVCVDTYDVSCIGWPLQVYTQLSGRENEIYRCVVNGDKYLVKDSVVYHLYRGSIFSSDSVLRKFSNSELLSESKAKSLLSPVLSSVGYFENYDAILKILGNIANISLDTMSRRKTIVKLALRKDIDRNRRDSNSDQYNFGGMLEFCNARSFIRSMDESSPYYWKDSNFLHEFLRYNVDFNNSNWKSFFTQKRSYSEKVKLTRRNLFLLAHNGIDILNKHLYVNERAYFYEVSESANGDLKAMGFSSENLEQLEFTDDMEKGKKIYSIESGDPHIISEDLTFEVFQNNKNLQESLLCDLSELGEKDLEALEYFFVGYFEKGEYSSRVMKKKKEKVDVDIRLPFCLHESFLYHLLYEKSVTEDWLNDWCNTKLVGSKVYVKETDSVAVVLEYIEESFSIRCNNTNKYSLMRDYGSSIFGFVYSDNLEPYADSDIWWVFETFFHLVCYWDDCYKIFEFILCRMINPLREDEKFRIQVNSHCKKSGSSIPSSLPLGSTFSPSLYDSMLRFFERRAEELLPSDAEMLQPAARQFLTRPYMSRSGRHRVNTYSSESLEYEQRTLQLSQRLNIFQSQYVRLIDYFMSNSLLSLYGNENASTLRWNSFLDFVLYHVAINLGMTPRGLHYLLNLSDHSQLIKVQL